MTILSADFNFLSRLVPVRFAVVKMATAFLFIPFFSMWLNNWQPNKESRIQLFSNCFLADTSKSATVYLAYPKGKEDHKIFIYFNGKPAGTLTSGDRTIYHFSTENLLQITISTEAVYREPATLASNTRSIVTKPNKEYYFEVNGRADLAYLVNTDKGKNRFADNTNYTSTPRTATEANTDAILKH